MNGHTAMPTITFQVPGTDYDTLDTILDGWIVRVWLKQGVILTGVWECSCDDVTTLRVQSRRGGIHDKPVTFPTDDVTKVSIL